MKMLSFFLPGKSRKLHHTLRLTALVLMIALICPTVAPVCAAVEINTAPLTGLAAERVKEFTEIARASFLQHYKAIWTDDKYDKLLSAAVKKSVDELPSGFFGRHIESMLDRSVEPARNAVEHNFNRHYDDFLKKLQDRFNEGYGRLLVEFYKSRVSDILDSTKDYKRSAFIKQRSNDLMANNGELLNQRVLEKLQANQKKMWIVAGVAGSIGLALTVSAFVECVRDYIATKLGISQAVVKWGAGIFGAVMIGVSVGEIGYEVWQAPDKLKLRLEAEFADYYEKEAPNDLWNAMQRFIEEGLLEAEDELQTVIRQANELGMTEIGQEATQGMSEERREDFLQRITIIANVLGIPNDDPGLIKDFSEVVKKATNVQMKTLVEMIQADYTQTKLWFTMMEPRPLFDLLGSLPKGIWRRYTPGQDSINTFQWMTKYLSPAARERAAEMDPESLQWVMKELPGKYVGRLFAGSRTWPELEEEIERLREIPIKSHRMPWQSWWKDLIYRYMPYIVMLVGGLLALKYFILPFIPTSIVIRRKKKKTFFKKRSRDIEADDNAEDEAKAEAEDKDE